MAALADETGSLLAIFPGCIAPEPSTSTSNYRVQLPHSAVAFSLFFPASYPDAPPVPSRPHAIALPALAAALDHVFRPGCECLYDLFLHLGASTVGTSIAGAGTTGAGVTGTTTTVTTVTGTTTGTTGTGTTTGTTVTGTTTTGTTWTTGPTTTTTLEFALSEPLLYHKSLFVARAVAISSPALLDTALKYIRALPKVVTATHPAIAAWRISPSDGSPPSNGYDNNGEPPAGANLLRLLTRLNLENILIVVTRNFGGTPLGPRRFRLISSVARQALVNGRFIK